MKPNLNRVLSQFRFKAITADVKKLPENYWHPRLHDRSRVTCLLAMSGVIFKVLLASNVSADDLSINQPAFLPSDTGLAPAPASEPPTIIDSISETLPSNPQPEEIWEGEVGDGFRHSVQTISLEAGGTVGVAMFGGRQRHDLGLASLSYGHMLSHVVAKDHWYRGNWEIRGELFGGAQFSPPTGGDWLVGLTPHLRYNFDTGTRWIPFIDAGAGVTVMKIGPPDLSGTFEFNLQANIGMQWFVKKDMAINAEVGYLHVSDASLHDPNLGLNAIKIMGGITWFFK
jgi:lipid A 3-O-deacylase